jgi:pimeloyl-ACP methyl ester carboxylesterase
MPPSPRPSPEPRPDPRLEIYARPQQLVRIGRRRRLNIHVTGQEHAAPGAPTIILCSGSGDTTLHWCRVQPVLARTHRVVAFDRAGLGFSDPGPRPRTASRIVADLRAALAAAGIGPPYVLVGHSMASFETRLFAFEHPEEVVGLVLVDPRGDDLVARCKAATPHGVWIDRWSRRWFRRNLALAQERPTPGSPEFMCLVGEADPLLPPAVNAALAEASLRPSTWATTLSEGASLDGACAAELAAARRRLHMPLIVLTAVNDAPMWGLPQADSDAVKAVWKASHEEIAALSDRGARRDVVGVGHGIQIDRPRVVIEAIQEVLAADG